MATVESNIRVETKYFPPSEHAVPALAVQTTRLVDIYMLWVGTTDVEPDQVDTAPLQGSFAKDWACAMPVRQTSGTPAAATPLYRTSTSEAALSMAQRLGDISAPRRAHGTSTDLPIPATPWGPPIHRIAGAARRFKKQIFLSIDIAPSLGSLGQEGKLLLAIERALVDTLKSQESAGQAQI